MVQRTLPLPVLLTAATNFVINGEYKRAGTFESKVGNKATGNSNMDIVVTNLQLFKTRPDTSLVVLRTFTFRALPES